MFLARKKIRKRQCAPRLSQLLTKMQMSGTATPHASPNLQHKRSQTFKQKPRRPIKGPVRPTLLPKRECILEGDSTKPASTICQRIGTTWYFHVQRMGKVIPNLVRIIGRVE